MTRAKPAEIDIAARVVLYLEGCGHDVYQEVALARGGGDVADIVALVGRGREVWIVEVKVGWSLDLLEQCRERRRCAQRVFAAVPAGRGSHAPLFAEFGIGTILVYGDSVHVAEMAPRLSSDPRRGRSVRARCAPEHKTHAPAGTPGTGGRFTPYTATCKALAEVVQRHPGILLKDAIGQIRHHYSSHAAARSSLAKWIEAGKVPGVALVAEGGKRWLHPKKEAA